MHIIVYYVMGDGRQIVGILAVTLELVVLAVLATQPGPRCANPSCVELPSELSTGEHIFKIDGTYSLHKKIVHCVSYFEAHFESKRNWSTSCFFFTLLSSGIWTMVLLLTHFGKIHLYSIFITYFNYKWVSETCH